MRIGRWLVIVMCGVGPLGAGCQLFEKPKEKGPSNSLQLGNSLDEVALIRGLSRLLEQAYVGIVSVSGEAAQNTTSTAIREDALRWRIWATSRVDAIRTIQDPRLRFAALWTMVTQFRINFTEGASANRFGPVQKYFTDFAFAAEQEVVQLGYDAFPNQVIDQARPEIEQIARTAGIAGWVDPEELGRRMSRSGSSPVMQILNIPLSPIAGLQGVGNTPQAINNFTLAARDMTQVVQRFPEQTRWQLELFMLEAQDSGAISSVLNEAAAMRKEAEAIRGQVGELGKTAEGIGKVVEGLPEKVGEQTREVLKSADAMQPQLGENLRQANTLVTSVQEAAGRIDVAARAVQAAASEGKALAGELNRPKPEGEKPKEEKKGDFTAEHVTQAAGEVRAAAAEIRLLVADLHAPATMPALARTTDRLDELVWKVTRNAAGLIVLAFVCGVVWLVVARRLRGARGT